LASAKGQLVVSNAAMRRQLLELEERILGLLSAAQGNILEDEELVDTLARSKVGGRLGLRGGCCCQCFQLPALPALPSDGASQPVAGQQPSC
jgi:cell division FtsZ-interacting protein ZapD